MTERPTAFRDLPQECFPFKVEFFGTTSGKLLHSIEVNVPGVMEIPALSKIHGEPIMVRTTYATGEVMEYRP